MRLVINQCFGGFGLSNKAIKRYLELQGKDVYFYKQTKYNHRDGYVEYTLYDGKDSGLFSITMTKHLGDVYSGEIYNKENSEYSFYVGDLKRDDPILVQVVEELTEEADGSCAKLRIVEIPDGVDYYIDDYDGQESVHEQHRSW